MHLFVYTFVSVLIVSLLSLIGVFFLALEESRMRKLLLYQVSFAVGGLFGDSFFHLLPEAFHNATSPARVSLYIVIGILMFFVLEKFIHWRHCHVPAHKHHVHPMVANNFIAEGVHNMIDGMLIGGSYLVSVPVGLATTLAVIAHEIPHEIGNFGVYIQGGLPVRKALVYNFLSALLAMVGAGISLYVGSHLEQFTQALMPITAGGFIYIAGSDLVPELHHDAEIGHSLLQLFFIMLGIGMMAALLLIG